MLLEKTISNGSKVQIKFKNQEMPKSKILNQVQDLVRHDKDVILNSFQNLIQTSDVDLKFACLREALQRRQGF